jgi:chondroitin 4-sulfotransferase 11
MILEKTRLNFQRPKGWIKGFSNTNSLFIHVPKAAGTSIADALYGEDPWHYPPSQYDFLSTSLTDSLFKFTFVRNPYTRLASTYKYSFKQLQINPNTSIKFICQFNSFADFVMNGLTQSLVDSHYFLKPQIHYNEMFKSKFNFDFIGRFENLAHDFDTVKHRLGLSCKLPNINKSPQDVSAIYNEKLAEIVYKFYQADFRMFNYDKESYA